MSKRESRVQCVLMADIVGFSRIRKDADLDKFIDRILVPISAITSGYESVEYLNTWGDGIMMLFRNVVDGCQCALQLRDLFRKDFGHEGLPDLGIRIGLHQGQVYWFSDNIRKCQSALGREIVVCARIEPRVRHGEVWVTDQVRVAFLSEGVKGIVFDDIGDVNLAKDYGVRKLYGLRRESDAESTKFESEFEDNPIRASKLREEMDRLYKVMATEISDSGIRDSLDRLYHLAIDDKCEP